MNIRDYPVERAVVWILSTVWFIVGTVVLAFGVCLVLILAGWQALDH